MFKGIINANEYITPEGMPTLPPSSFTFISDYEQKIKHLIETYENERRRLKTELPSDGALTVIDAYNKGRLYEKETFIDDLKLLLDEKNQKW